MSEKAMRLYISKVMAMMAEPAMFPLPTVVITEHMYATFAIAARAEQKQWNWRRTKRELRKIGLVRKGVRRNR